MSTDADVTLPSAGDVGDIARFLAGHSPFQELPRDEIDRLARAATTHSAPVGAVVATYGATGSTTSVWMVRAGRVDLLDVDGRHRESGRRAAPSTGEPFEEVGTGGLFGYLPLIIGPQVRFTAVAVEPSTVIELPAELMAAVLRHHAGTAFVAESAARYRTARRPHAARWSATRPVIELVRRPPVFVGADTTVAEAARAMRDGDQSCVLIEQRDGMLGILTDSDVIRRVVGAGLPVTVPVHRVMSQPARTVEPDRHAVSAWLDMLESGVRHLPVRAAHGRALGVLEEADLLVATSQGGSIHRQIATVADVDELRRATRRLPRLADDLTAGGLDAESTSGVLSLAIDTAARRALDMARLDATTPLDDFAWITLGSVARREAMPSSDIDTALSWADDHAAEATAYRAMAARTHAILAACGLPPDSNGAIASAPRFSRSAGQWRAAALGWADAPVVDRGLIMSSLMIDGRVVDGRESLHTAPAVYADMVAEHPEALRLQLLDALSVTPRIRSLRDVLAHRGGTVDLKCHVINPIVNLARWAGLSAGITSASTPSRLQQGAAVGSLTDADAALLAEVFATTQRLRLRHQIEQIRAGRTPGDVVVMADLSPLQRSLLGEAVREITAVQRRVAHVTSMRGSGG